MTPQEAVAAMIAKKHYKKHVGDSKLSCGAPEALEVHGKYYFHEGQRSNCVYTSVWCALEALRLLGVTELFTPAEVREIIKWGFCRLDLQPKRYRSGLPGVLVEMELARWCEPSELDLGFVQLWDYNNKTKKRGFEHSIIGIKPSVHNGRASFITWGCEWEDGISKSWRYVVHPRAHVTRELYTANLDAELIEQFKDRRL